MLSPAKEVYRKSPAKVKLCNKITVQKLLEKTNKKPKKYIYIYIYIQQKKKKKPKKINKKDLITKY